MLNFLLEAIFEVCASRVAISPLFLNPFDLTPDPPTHTIISTSKFRCGGSCIQSPGSQGLRCGGVAAVHRSAIALISARSIAFKNKHIR